MIVLTSAGSSASAMEDANNSGRVSSVVRMFMVEVFMAGEYIENGLLVRAGWFGSVWRVRARESCIFSLSNQ